MRKVIAIATLLLTTFIFYRFPIQLEDETYCIEEPVETVIQQEKVVIEEKQSVCTPMPKVGKIEKVVEEEFLSDEDIALIALVTMAEAEGECERGKRLVIDTILNRIDSEHFPDNVHDVIYQKNQFSSMWNGRIDRCEVREDICQLVREEGKSRINDEVIFFTADGYSKYGVPLFQVEDHYFSSYE